MRNYVDKMAKYTALILISSLPFSIETLTASEKEQFLAASQANAEKDTLKNKLKVPEETE